VSRGISDLQALLDVLRGSVTAPLTGLLIFSALALILVARGLGESSGNADPSKRLLDQRTTLLLAAFASAVVARFLLLSG
jgi:hypothetical protein